eukprot:CAMPEP_0181539994 /NCGR_PEP_ID=MMETSP1110-20121109/76663_1 /TAXON_ID=174948 /ORGANISM="Symbiodinium sp., Strain CCMP421" /LENGTH=96 /DNA_ID=CAMNT_0023671633 /DNA_START=223 /DNA_END=513 /DNA_ORIENTATION=-
MVLDSPLDMAMHRSELPLVQPDIHIQQLASAQETFIGKGPLETDQSMTMLSTGGCPSCCTTHTTMYTSTTGSISTVKKHPIDDGARSGSTLWKLSM